MIFEEQEKNNEAKTKETGRSKKYKITERKETGIS